MREGAYRLSIAETSKRRLCLRVVRVVAVMAKPPGVAYPRFGMGLPLQATTGPTVGQATGRRRHRTSTLSRTYRPDGANALCGIAAVNRGDTHAAGR